MVPWEKVRWSQRNVQFGQDCLLTEGLSQLENAQEALYGPVILVTKMSILLLYSRLFDARHTLKSKTYICTQLLIYFNTLFYIAVTLVKVFECTPRSKIWEPQTPGHCINFQALLYVTGIVNVISDVALIILPVGGVCALQMPVARKVGVVAAFGAAIL